MMQDPKVVGDLIIRYTELIDKVKSKDRSIAEDMRQIDAAYSALKGVRTGRTSATTISLPHSIEIVDSLRELHKVMRDKKDLESLMNNQGLGQFVKQVDLSGWSIQFDDNH